MKINGLVIPDALTVDLDSGGRVLTDEELVRFKQILTRVESPLPKLFNYEEILDANRFLESEAVNDYLGSFCTIVVPGILDPTRAVIIGEAEPDSPIALDYRTCGPRIIYFGDINYECYWIELATDYPSLIQMLQGKVE